MLAIKKKSSLCQKGCCGVGTGLCAKKNDQPPKVNVPKKMKRNKYAPITYLFTV
jgi:hypothetical protein